MKKETKDYLAKKMKELRRKVLKAKKFEKKKIGKILEQTLTRKKQMSNNAPDYENDLVFPPASTDVHTTTIEKCEKLENTIRHCHRDTLERMPAIRGLYKSKLSKL